LHREPWAKAKCDAVNAVTPVRKFVAAPAAQHRACIGATDALLMPLVNTLIGDKVVHRHFAPRERTFLPGTHVFD